jgi:hypothetical protein
VKHRPTPPRKSNSSSIIVLQQGRQGLGSQRCFGLSCQKIAARERRQVSMRLLRPPVPPYGIFLRCAVIAQAGQPSNGT